MSGFIQGEDRTQATLFPERLDDYVAEDSPVRVIDVFIDELDLGGLGFKTQPNETGRPAYLHGVELKLIQAEKILSHTRQPNDRFGSETAISASSSLTTASGQQAELA
jgi:hypothetical protein